MAKLQIAVFGGSTTTDKKLLNLAKETGRLIAAQGATLFVGNVKGILGAALNGAKEGQGTTVVIAPYDHKDVDRSNCDVYIASSMNWFSRGPSLVNSLDGIIVIGGGVGTLTEMTYAWWQEIPIVIIKTGELTDQYIGKTFDKRKQHVVLGASDPKEAFKKLMQEIQKKK